MEYNSGSNRASSLQCRRSFECLAAILNSLETGRMGARMRDAGGGGGR